MFNFDEAFKKSVQNRRQGKASGVELALEGKFSVDGMELSVGKEVNFYDKKSGQKLYGVIQRFDGKEIVIKAEGKRAQLFICVE